MNSEQANSPVLPQVLQLSRGCEAVYTQQELEKRLVRASQTGKALRVKLGLDPTAPDIHLGHTVVLRKMRQFQDLGHKAVLIIGDYTARIGDPSGVNKTRPVLDSASIETNARTYFQQAGRILDTSSDKLEVRYNSEWLGKLSFADVLKLASQMTVARMMERDSFEKRYKAGAPIGVHEFLYPLMQGYDSVCVEADVELGGSDQTFNNLVGRALQENYNQAPQVVMIMPILAGLDGVEKMSKSKGNYIAVTDSPGEMFGKIMSIPDTLMRNYFTLLTDTPVAEIDKLVDAAQTHPRQAKAILGRAVVAQYHGEAQALAASDEFDRVFAQKQIPADMPEITPGAERMNIVTLIVQAGFAKTTSEARRLVEQAAVSLDDAKVTDVKAEVDLKDGMVLQVGKRRFGKIVMRE
ncbi:MAG: tyrosine--tRNA ligase [Planctomycetes bacterium]|nr:tyrosine--tRNA ligase [Planctomycetota bacterium]